MSIRTVAERVTPVAIQPTSGGESAHHGSEACSRAGSSWETCMRLTLG